MVNYIHEQELASMALEMWDKLYNHTPFTPYDEKYLKTLYKDLFKFDRENRWIVIHSSVNYDIWTQAYNEHHIISKLIAKIFAYIEPFDYIENLIKPYTNEEETCYKEKWGGVNMMKKEEALHAVENGCNYILQTAKSVENALLLFDDFANAILMWKVCGMIDSATQYECTDFVLNAKEIYRRSLAKC